MRSKTLDTTLLHGCTGGSLFNFLLQSHINITTTALYRMHLEGRVKAMHVSSLLHLMAALEFIKLSVGGEKALILLDGLSGLFLAQKVRFIVLCTNVSCMCDQLFERTTGKYGSVHHRWTKRQCSQEPSVAH